MNVPAEITTIGRLIDYLKISRQGTGVGLNSHLVPNQKWDMTPIRENDSLVIISATYGG